MGVGVKHHDVTLISNSNSIFIALNLHLKTDSRHTKKKKTETSNH